MKNKKRLITYGLIGGAILLAGFFIGGLIMNDDPSKIDFTQGMWFGYATMILALSTVFFGVKSYRDRERNGLISFKDAFLNGMIVVLIASVLYVVGWMIYYPNFMPDFADQYLAFQKEQLQSQGLSQAEITSKIEQLEAFNETYKKPLVMAGYTFLEVFPVGLLIALVSAFMLKRTTTVAE